MGRRGAWLPGLFLLVGALAAYFAFFRTPATTKVEPPRPARPGDARLAGPPSPLLSEGDRAQPPPGSLQAGPGWTLMGSTVRDDGTPLPSAEVVLRLEGGKVIVRASTGAGGGFIVEGGPPQARVELDLTAPGAARRLLWENLPPPPEEGEESIIDLGEVILGRPCAITVLLRGAADAPVRGAEVTICPWLSPEQSDRDQVLHEAGDGGLYRLDVLPAGKHRLEVKASGFPPFEKLIWLPRQEPLVVELPPAFEIAGSVSGEDGQPLPAAKVMVTLSRVGPRLRREVITGPDGGFEAGELLEEVYRVDVSAEGHVPASVEDIPAGTLDLSIELVSAPPVTERDVGPTDQEEPPAGERIEALSVQKATGSIRGTMVDPEDKPIARATAYLDSTWHRRPFRADREGKFLARSLAPGTRELRVAAEGYLDTLARVSVEAEKAALARVVLTPEGRISGRILAGGVAIFDVAVSAYPETDRQHAAATSSSDGEGRFVLGRLAAGTYRVVGKVPRVISRMKVGVVVEAGKTTEVGDLRLEEVPDEAVSGRVLDGDGRAVPGAWVHILLNPPERDVAGSVSGPDGQFTIGGLAAHAYLLQVRKPGYDFRPVKVTAPVSDLELVLRKLRGLAGRVVDGATARPVAGAKVFALSGDERDGGRCFWNGGYANQVESDRQGRFRFGVHRHRSEIRYLVVESERHALAFTRVEEKEVAGEVVVTLAPGIDFQARVLDERGQPVPRVEACLVDREAGFYRGRIKADEDGLVVFPGTREGGYHLVLRRRNQAIREFSVGVSAGAAPAILILDGSGAGALTVRFQKEDGRSVSSAEVEIFDEKGVDALGLLRAFEEGGVVTEGSRVFTHLPRGRYRLRARSGGSVSAEAEIEIGGEPVEVTLTLP